MFKRACHAPQCTGLDVTDYVQHKLQFHPNSRGLSDVSFELVCKHDTYVQVDDTNREPSCQLLTDDDQSVVENRFFVPIIQDGLIVFKKSDYDDQLLDDTRWKVRLTRLTREQYSNYNIDPQPGQIFRSSLNQWQQLYEQKLADLVKNFKSKAICVSLAKRTARSKDFPGYHRKDKERPVLRRTCSAPNLLPTTTLVPAPPVRLQLIRIRKARDSVPLWYPKSIADRVQLRTPKHSSAQGSARKRKADDRDRLFNNQPDSWQWCDHRSTNAYSNPRRMQALREYSEESLRQAHVEFKPPPSTLKPPAKVNLWRSVSGVSHGIVSLSPCLFADGTEHCTEGQRVVRLYSSGEDERLEWHDRRSSDVSSQLLTEPTRTSYLKPFGHQRG